MKYLGGNVSDTAEASQSSPGIVSDPGRAPGDAVIHACTNEAAMGLETLMAELGVLMATDRRLTASEERKRSWLVREIARLETAQAREAAAVEAARDVKQLSELRAQWAALLERT